MALKSMPKVGDIITYIGETHDYLTNGNRYQIVGIDEDGEAYFFDDMGEEEYLRQHKFGNYSPEDGDEIEDPGYLDVYERYPIDTTGTGKVEVVVDEKSLALLYKLQRDHERAKARRKIKEKIAALEEELKKI